MPAKADKNTKRINWPPGKKTRGKFLYCTTQERLDFIAAEAQATATSKASIIDWAIDTLIESLKR